MRPFHWEFNRTKYENTKITENKYNDSIFIYRSTAYELNKCHKFK